MFKLVRKWWKYLTAKLTGSFEANADPKVQLEQAIQESQAQHQRLKEQVINVVANQKQAELKLNRSIDELGKVNANARQALLMAEDARKKGDEAGATQYTHAAESLAGKLIQLEADVEDQKSFLLQATEASDQAKAALSQNARVLQQKLGEKSKLLSQLDQANMQDQMNKAMAQLNETVGQDVPTFNEIRDKIESRYAKAKAGAEIAETSVESRMIEIEQATANVEAQSRLSQLRSELGLDAPGATPAVEQSQEGSAG
ncbi:MAG: PspA/IM30 family protein [Acidimicrobiia bacterium]